MYPFFKMASVRLQVRRCWRKYWKITIRSHLNPQVLHTFKSLHRVARTIFAGDERALFAARTKINDDFKKNKSVENKESIVELLKFGEEVEKELRTSVVQAKRTKPNVYGMFFFLFVNKSFYCITIIVCFCRIENERRDQSIGQCYIQRGCCDWEASSWWIWKNLQTAIVSCTFPVSWNKVKIVMNIV